MKKIKMNKKGFEFSFAWLFSIIAGSAILFLAIFAATRLITSGEYETNTKTAADFKVILDPLGTSFESAKSERIEFIKETRIYLGCNEKLGDFGESSIQLSEKSSFKEEWTNPGGKISTKNQYLFAENIIEGKELYFLVTPFEMPYKVSDVMSIFSGSYCFVAPPQNIKNEIIDLSRNGIIPINVTTSKTACPQNSKTVCFQSGGCDINVQGTCNSRSCRGNVFKSGIVEKGGKRIYYSGGLMYGAIFSSVENYECNVARLMKKTGYVSKIYADKSKLVSDRCNTGLTSDTFLLSQMAESYKKLDDLKLIEMQAEIIDDKNNVLGECNLY